MRIEGITSRMVHSYLDSVGFRTLSIDGEVPTLLSEAFEDDIQTTRDTGFLYDQLACVAKGRHEELSFSGNTCTVVFGPGCVRIESDVGKDIEPLEMSAAQYLVILDVWARFLRGGSEDRTLE